MKKIIARDKIQLKNLISYHIGTYGNNCNLCGIDVSNITDMSELFINSKFNGNISNWDVSNVKNMQFMFFNSEFNSDISRWDVSNLKNMHRMFYASHFNGAISKWNVSNVTDMNYMFAGSFFEGSLNNWDVSNVKNLDGFLWNTLKHYELKDWSISKDCSINYFCMYNYSGNLPHSILDRLYEVFETSAGVESFLRKHKEMSLNKSHIKRCLSLTKKPSYLIKEQFDDIKKLQQMYINLELEESNLIDTIYLNLTQPKIVPSTFNFE